MAKRMALVLLVLAFAVSCASTPKARYYENLDMYDFVMTQFRTTYDTATVVQQQKMDKEVLPLLKAWKDARLVWKSSMNDATKERAAMLAWSQAKYALLTYGVVTEEEVQ